MSHIPVDRGVPPPDQLLPADSFTSIDPTLPVKLVSFEGGSRSDYRPPQSVPSLLAEVTRSAPDHIALAVKREGVWQKWTYTNYLKEIRTVAKAFIKLGLLPAHGVGIIGFNSPEWFLADLGCVFAGGLATGIYPTNSPSACQYVLHNCQANIAVVEDEKQVAKVLAVRDALPHLKVVVQYLGTPTEEGVMSWKDLMELGAAEGEEELEGRLGKLAPNLCCHLVYTSGTTGPPKGVMLSHDNITFTTRTIVEHYGFQHTQERFVSYLPLSHVVANMIDIFGSVTCAGTTYFAQSDALKGTLTTTLKEAKPTMFFGVPRVWEKIKEKMVEVGKANTGVLEAVGIWAKRTGLDHNRAIIDGRGANSISYMVANMLVFQKVKEALGFGETLCFFSGAAPISSEVIDYFLSLDIKILEVYGMSETSGPQTGNDYQHYRVGTIGKDLPGFHTKLDSVSVENREVCPPGGGEICMRGRNVFMGYLREPDKTREAFDLDGWHHSGDVGTVEGEYYTITGRIKEIIVTAGGENIPHVIIEEMVKAELPCLSNVLLVGDRRKFLSCLVTMKVEMDPETMEPLDNLSPVAMEWCKGVGSKVERMQDVLRGPDQKVMEGIQKGIDRVNKGATSSAQRIQKWTILPTDFSIPGGEIGPTMKLKRHYVLKKYSDNVDKLYT